MVANWRGVAERVAIGRNQDTRAELEAGRGMGHSAHHHRGIEHGMTRLIGAAARGVGDMLAFRGHRHTHMVGKPHGVKAQTFGELGGFYGPELIRRQGTGQYVPVIPISQTVRSRIYADFHGYSLW